MKAKKPCLGPDCLGVGAVKGLCRRCYMRQYMRTYENKGRKTQDRSAEHRSWYAKNKEKVKKAALERSMKAHGFTPEDYLLELERQGGGCAICKARPSSKKRLAIDHCHRTGGVRGLLCDTCNRGIGMFRDDPSRLESAKQYLLRSRG